MNAIDLFNQVEFLELEGVEPINADQWLNLLNWYARDMTLAFIENNPQLTKIEILMTILRLVTKDICSPRTGYEGLCLKTWDFYTNDGYLLNSQVWYQDCHIDGMKISVYGRTLEDVVNHSIYLFSMYRILSRNEFERLEDIFLDYQRRHARDWAKYV